MFRQEQADAPAAPSVHARAYGITVFVGNRVVALSKASQYFAARVGCAATSDRQEFGVHEGNVGNVHVAAKAVLISRTKEN